MNFYITLCFLFIILPNIYTYGYELIPIRTEGRTMSIEINVIKVLIGTPAKTYRLALDFKSRVIHLRSRDIIESSTTFSKTQGGSDIVYIHKEVARFPIRFDNPYAGFDLECPTCDGSLGLSMNSPVWLRWGCARFTLGDFELIPCEHYLQNGHEKSDIPWTKCEESHFDVSSFCAFQVDFMDKTQISAKFDFSNYDTEIPSKHFAKYIGSKDITRNLYIGDWDSISFHLKEGKGTTITIPPEHLISYSERGVPHLHLTPNGRDVSNLKDRRSFLSLSVNKKDVSNKEYAQQRHGIGRRHSGYSNNQDQIVMGRSILRSSVVYVDPVHRYISLYPWTSQRLPSTIALCLLVLLTILFVRWKMTRDHVWKGSRKGPYRDREAIAFVIIIICATLYLIPSIQNATSPFVEYIIYYSITVSFCGISIIVSYIIQYSGRSFWFGPLYIEKKNIPITPRGPRGTGPSPSSSTPPSSSSFSSSSSSSSHYNNSKISNENNQILTSRRTQRSYTKIGNKPSNPNIDRQNFNSKYKKLDVRLSIILDDAVTFLFSVALLTIIIETRTLTLASTMALFFVCGLLFYLYLFTLIIIMFSRVLPMTFLWTLFVAGHMVCTVYSTIIAYKYFIRPYIDESFPWPTWVPTVTSISMFIFIFMLAIRLFLIMTNRMRREFNQIGTVTPKYASFFGWDDTVTEFYQSLFNDVDQ